MSLPPNLPHHIRNYLTGSEVDLQTVSAKQIRTKIASIFPDLDVKALRSEIDGISIPIFHEIKENVEAAARAAEKKASMKAIAALNPAQGNNKLSNSLPPLALPPRGIPGVVMSTNTTSVPKKTNPPPPTSTTSTSNQKNSKQTPGKTKKRKSAAYVDTDDEDAAPDGGSSKKKKDSKKPKGPKKPRPEGEGPGSNKGIHVELNCSTALAELIGVPMCSRPQVVKKIWEHIKSKGLQDPQDKRQIICDEAMKKVFNQNSVHMFTMNKLLADHLYKSEEVVQKPPE